MNKLKILIVDDEVDIVEYAKRYFEYQNCEVLNTMRGSECVNLYKEFKPDVILLDILMDDLDGIEALKQLRIIDKGVGIIMISGIKDAKRKAKESLKLGADDYIEKPVDLDEVMDKIIEVLRKKGKTLPDKKESF